MAERVPGEPKDRVPGDDVIAGRSVVAGAASGRVLLTDEPLSFWGGYDPETGEITDRSHPLSGVSGTGRVLVIPETRGSSTTTAVLLEAIRRGTAPAAFVTRGVDAFLALAAVVAEEMYGRGPPVVALAPGDFDGLVEFVGRWDPSAGTVGVECAIDESGRLTCAPEGSV